MQIDYLILFHKIASEKSISKVAKDCHLSQPALSQQMRKLEEEIGFRLFTRSNRGIELTSNGKVAHKYFRQIIETYENLLEEIKSLNNYSGTIRVFASHVIGQYALPCTINKMNEKFPKFHFTLTTMSSDAVSHKITEEKGSIGFVVGMVDNSDLVSKHVYTDKCYLVCSEKFYKEASITLEKLKSYPMIKMSDHFCTQKILNQELKMAGHDIEDFNVLMNLDSTESVKVSVIANLGFAFLPYMSIKKEVYLKQLKIIEVPEFQVDYDLYMVFKKKKDSFDAHIDVINYFEIVVDKTFC